MAFAGVGTDGSTIFEASLLAGQGIRQELGGLGHRGYTISLHDPGFSLRMLLAVVVALVRA